MGRQKKKKEREGLGVERRREERGKWRMGKVSLPQ